MLISGTVFRGSNRNGAWNSGEPGLAGWRVFLDLDRDGVWDANEYNRLTDASGNYSFGDVPADSYVLRVVRQSGWTAPESGSYSITLSAGQSTTWKLFGFSPSA